MAAEILFRPSVSLCFKTTIPLSPSFVSKTMAPNKKKAKKAATHVLSDLLGSDWLIHSSKGLDYPDDLDYPSDDLDYPDYMEEDDTDSHSDQCLLMSGDEQTMAEGHARACALATKRAAKKKKAIAAKLAAKRNKSNDGEEAAKEDSVPSEAADEDYPPANEDAMPSEVANGGVADGEADDEEKETVGEESYDINDKMGGTSFKEFRKQWKSNPLVDDYLKWTADSFGIQPRNGSQDNGKNKENPKNINLPMNRHGYPVLPSWEAINPEGATYKKLLIGKFMTQLYKVAAGGGKGRIPWARLSEAPDDFILPMYLLNDITLTQYHHICVEDADALLKHWTQRQAAREIPFQFKNGVNTDWCGKKVSVNANTSNPVGPRDQSEGTLQDSQENQE
ncbi:hypothetical protein EI94DRAFT_1808036 [Lactarius quietus]|nr:hypothetical protein EI94DRAFT_1808036 [Lactarius quietus]